MNTYIILYYISVHSCKRLYFKFLNISEYLSKYEKPPFMRTINMRIINILIRYIKLQSFICISAVTFEMKNSAVTFIKTSFTYNTQLVWYLVRFLLVDLLVNRNYKDRNNQFPPEHIDLGLLESGVK